MYANILEPACESIDLMLLETFSKLRQSGFMITCKIEDITAGRFVN